jgi:hypothetical protein
MTNIPYTRHTRRLRRPVPLIRIGLWLLLVGVFLLLFVAMVVLPIGASPSEVTPGGGGGDDGGRVVVIIGAITGLVSAIAGLVTACTGLVAAIRRHGRTQSGAAPEPGPAA